MASEPVKNESDSYYREVNIEDLESLDAKIAPDVSHSKNNPIKI